MKLYLVRHGEAVEANVDPERPLSPTGRDTVGRMAQHLERRGASLHDIRSSTKARARETAEIMARQVAPAALAREVAGLAPNDGVGPFVDEAQICDHDLMLVGHLPFLPSLARKLLGAGQADKLSSFDAGAVVILERGADGTWHIDAQLSPRHF